MTKHCENPHREWKYRLWHGLPEDKRMKKDDYGKDEERILVYQFIYILVMAIFMVVASITMFEGGKQFGIFLLLLSIIVFTILNLHNIYFYGLKTGWQFGFGVIAFFGIISLIVGFFYGLWLFAGSFV